MMFVDKLSVLSFLTLGALGVANLLAAIGTLRGTRKVEELGEGRFEPLRDQHERLELLREKRRMLTDVLERERRERLEAQEKTNQLMPEYLSLEFSLELQRLTEEQGLEREGRTHKHRERQRLGEELERERLARPRGSTERPTPSGRISGAAEVTQVTAAGSQGSEEGLWIDLLRCDNHQGPIG